MIPGSELLPTLSVLSLVLTVCMIVGGFFAFRNGRQTQLAKFQKDTNDALEQRIKAMEGKNSDLEKEVIIQRHLIETITQALEQRGLIITINGDMITIEDKTTGHRSNHRKRLTPHTPSPTTKKEGEKP